jgi:enolase
MKLLYKPFGIIAGVIGAKAGQKLFDRVWARIDGGPPPGPKARDASLGRIVAAQALEAASLAGAGAAADRLGMRWFHYLTGIWPGDKPEVHDAEGGGEADAALVETAAKS